MLGSDETSARSEHSGIDRELRSERDLLAVVLDTGGALVIVLDHHGRILRFNRACERTTGYVSEEVRGRPFWDFLLIPEQVEPVKAAFTQLHAGQIPSTYENYWVTRDGRRRWIAWSTAVLVGEHDSIDYIVGTGIDITEHRRAEEDLQRALAESQRRQAEVSALLAAARQILEQHRFEDTARSILDTCKSLIGAAAGCVALSSRDGAEDHVLFLDPGEIPCLVTPTPPVSVPGLRGQVYRTGTVAYENDFRSSPWAGQLPEEDAAVENLLFAPLVIGGQVVGLLGLANKPGGFGENDARLAGAFGELVAIALQNSQLIGSLEESEIRFRSVVETANAAIITADDHGRIRFWNPMAERIFGYTAQEMDGAPLARIVPERFQDGHRAGIQRVIAAGGTRLAGETVQTIGVRKGGDEFPLELSLATWKTADGTFFTALLQDITQRKQFEEDLREAKQSMEILIAASPLAILAVDLDLNVRLWNPAAERIFGWSESEALGHPYPLVPESRKQEFEGFFAQMAAGKALSGRETVRHKKDGTPIDVSIWTAPLYDAAGQIRNVMAVIADISDRKRAEEALRRYAHEQNALYTVASAIAGTLDQDELLPVVLDAVLPAVGADVGWILLPSARPTDPPRVVTHRDTVGNIGGDETMLTVQDCPIYRCLAPEGGSQVEPCLVLDCPALAAGGGMGELRSLVCVPLYAGQQFLGVLKLGWRQTPVQRQQSRELLLSIGRQVGVALHNAQLYQAALQVNRLQALSELDRALAATLELGKVAEVTLHHLTTNLHAPAALVLRPPSPAHGRPAIQIFVPERGWERVGPADRRAIHGQDILDRLADRREPTEVPAGEMAGEEGAPAHAKEAPALAVPIWGENALLAVLVLAGRPANRPFSDEDRALARVAASHAGQAMQNAQLYEEVRRLLHEQEQARAQLIQIEKLGALGRLTATMAHEINNPLQAIQTCLTLAREEMEGHQRRDKVDRYLEVAGGEVGRISAIVRRMRDFYRPANERLEPTDLRALLDSVLDLSGRELQHRNIAVERLDGAEVPLIQANPDHLKQVFLNLILNAADAMPSGGTLGIRTRLDQMLAPGSELPQPAACVEISDDGHGMPPEVQARLFEPFFTTKEEGGGLGLSITYNIVEAHNGQITVKSEAGVGTTFIIRLPLPSA